MNNSINNDINRFDGKYLKCIVSKYPSVVKYLANSGSMIILQPQNEQISQDIVYDEKTNSVSLIDTDDIKQRNYIYLGNEFLASGYGFSTVSYRDTGEQIVRTYHNTIKELKQADLNEAKTRKDEDDKIWKKFEDYVAVKGGPIESTIFRINDNNIPTKDIILYGEEAQYEDLKVEDVSIVLYDINNVPYIAKDGVCVFPFGAIVTNISIEILTRDNDSGGLNYLEVLHDFNNGNYTGNEGLIVSYDTDVENSVIIQDNIDEKYNTHKWYYHKQLNSSSLELIVNANKNNVVKNVYLYVKATPSTKYKKYPGLERKGYNLISSGNAIKDHKIDLNASINVKPQYYIQYNFKSSSDMNFTYFYNSNSAKLNLTDETDITEVNILLDYNSTNNYNHIQIAIPSNFALRKLYLIQDNIEKFNLTGCVYKIKSNILLPCAKSKIITDNSNNANDEFYCSYHDIYIFETNQTFEANVNICLEIAYDNKNEIQQVIKKKRYELNNEFNTSNVNEFINDEDFNNLYWINGNTDINTLKDKIANANENGINKE